MGGWPSHINTFIRNSGRGRGPQLTEKPTRQGPVTLFHRRRGVLYILWSWLTSTVDDEVEEDLMNVWRGTQLAQLPVVMPKSKVGQGRL